MNSENFDDPVPDPYPEFEAEMFDFYFETGVKPESIKDVDERQRYLRWIAQQKGQDA